MASGNLKVNVYNGTIANPVKGASVTISKNGNVITEVKTDEFGSAGPITLETVSKS